MIYDMDFQGFYDPGADKRWEITIDLRKYGTHEGNWEVPDHRPWQVVRKDPMSPRVDRFHGFGLGPQERSLGVYNTYEEAAKVAQEHFQKVGWKLNALRSASILVAMVFGWNVAGAGSAPVCDFPPQPRRAVKIQSDRFGRATDRDVVEDTAAYFVSLHPEITEWDPNEPLEGMRGYIPKVDEAWRL